MSETQSSNQSANQSDSNNPLARQTAITIARGDGIGPDIMDATLFLLKQAGAALDIEEIQVGQKVYERGITAGIEDSSWDSLERTGVLLKAPITTPRGKGYKSLNVTIRKTLGLFANVRPCPTYHPYVHSMHPKMDVVIIRENEEDTYGGIEHRQTNEVTQCLKLITRPGCEKIVRYAFEYAKAHGRKKVTCFVKDNIMKITDGLFRDTFELIAKDYPEIEAENRIIDIGSAKLANDPTQFDVIVLPNLYGDIVSDIAAEISGSVGLAGSANIGTNFAMFEAIHGSAPDIAGKGIANPSGLFHASIMMLDHLGQSETAQVIHNAWLRTIEDGVLTPDMVGKQGIRATGTDAFAHAVANRLGSEPMILPKAVHKQNIIKTDGWDNTTTGKPTKALVGVDVFMDWDQPGRDPNALGQELEALSSEELKLKMITNRGSKVYPNGNPATFCTDHWRCRFTNPQGKGEPVSHANVVDLLHRLSLNGFDFIKTEHLYTFDGQPGYSLGQGE